MPEPLVEKDWRSVWSLLKEFSSLQVLESNEEVELPAGGFLLQGALEQTIEEDRVGPVRQGTGLDELDKELNLAVSQCFDQTIIVAFAGIKPAEYYEQAQHKHSKVVYRALESYTVILVMKDQLKSMWQESGDRAKLAIT